MPCKIAGSDVWKTVGITEGPAVLNGPGRRVEDQVLKALNAVAQVFPRDSSPFSNLDQHRCFRESLEELDSRLRPRSEFFGNQKIRAEQFRLFRHAIATFETDLRLARKQKLARMALSQDWSGMAPYLIEGLDMWRCRLKLRALLFRLRVHRSHATSEISNARPVVGRCQAPPPATSESYSGMRSSMEKLGLDIAKVSPPDVIRSGSLSLDEALGVGGFPRGRIIEIFGGPGTGKTTLALTAAANVQRDGQGVAYVDVEHKLDTDWAQTNGLIPDQALILKGSQAKAVIGSVLELAQSGRFALIIVDSLSSLVPNEDLEEDPTDFSAEIDKLLARALPRIIAAADKTNTCVLLLNQIRRSESMFGRDKVSTGGDAVAHYSSIRLELSRMMAQKEGERIVGYGVKATVLKSCVAAPFRVADWTINFERGVHPAAALIEFALKRGAISKSSKGLTLGAEHLGTTEDEARTYLSAHPDIAAVLEKRLREENNVNRSRLSASFG